MVIVRVYRKGEPLLPGDQALMDRMSEYTRRETYEFLVFGESSSMASACARELANNGSFMALNPQGSEYSPFVVYGVQRDEIDWQNL